MELHPGLEVTPSLRLEGLIGEGGMGTVWEAQHLGLRARVAVKFIDPGLAAESPTMLARFQREAKAVAQLKSPHIVQIFDTGQTVTGLPYIVMEMLEGEDLNARLDREKRLRVGDALTILRHTARALGRAHAAGIVHRDVKPDNIFLVDGGDGQIFVKVLDFGVAKQTKAQSYSVVTMTGTMVGTPAYMSPEQILSGKEVDLRSDLWSLGVVAYHALCGEPPFDGETLGALCVAISKGSYVPPTERRPDLPQALDVWMRRALAQDPAHRFDSAKEMVDAFERAAQGVAPALREPMPEAPAPSSAVDVSLLPPMPNAEPEPKPRRKLAAVIVAGLLIGIGGVLAAAWMTANEEGASGSEAESEAPSAGSEAEPEAESETATPSAEAETPSTETETPSTETATPSAETETPSTEPETPSAEPEPETTPTPPPTAAAPPPPRPAPLPTPLPKTKDRGF